MKLGDIKIEALKLMFVTNNDDLVAENLQELGSIDAYRSYLLSMNGSINRCLSDIENRRILPTRSILLDEKQGTEINGRLHFQIPQIAPDFFDVDRLIYDTVDRYDGDHAFLLQGDRLIVSEFDCKALYELFYFPKIRRIDDSFGNMDELPIPQEIAEWIPYFVKGDLYRDDEPNEASAARNLYESAMDNVLQKRVNRYTNVKDVYSQVML